MSLGSGNGDDGDAKVPPGTKRVVTSQQFTIEIIRESYPGHLSSSLKERTPENDLIPEYIFQAG